MRRLRPFLLALVVFVAVSAALTWCVYPDLRQRQLDNRLLAAISRSDTPAVLSLLDQGANPNAHGDATATLSLWQVLLLRFRNSRPQQQDALDWAFSNHIPNSESPNALIVTILLEHGARLVTKQRTNVGVCQAHFHHGSQSVYVDIGWHDHLKRSADGDESVTLYDISEKQAETLVRVVLQSGAQRF